MLFLSRAQCQQEWLYSSYSLMTRYMEASKLRTSWGLPTSMHSPQASRQEQAKP